MLPIYENSDIEIGSGIGYQIYPVRNPKSKRTESIERGKEERDGRAHTTHTRHTRHDDDHQKKK
jgi:hypothetical protein